MTAYELVLERLEQRDCRPRETSSGRAATACCPNHDDRNPSLSITNGDGKVLLHCHAGCEQEAVIAALDLEKRDLFDRGEGGVRGFTNRATAQQGCTLEQYAKAKRLPLDLLRALGISDYKDNRWPNRVLRIPWRDKDGNEQAVRIRFGLSGSRCSLWRKGSRPLLYGAWRLGELRGCAVVGGGHTPPTPQVVIVEGESDCHTLWHHGIPALGLPGAGNWREQRDADVIRAFEQVYVLIEPDQGGEAVHGWLSRSSTRDRAWLVELDGFKDPSSLYLDDPARFGERWRAAIEAAEPWRERAAKIETAERREVGERCASLAREPRILDHLVGDAERAGVTGEADTVKIVYLVLTSRLLDRLASIVVKGQSSSGKSWVTQQTARFVPPSAYYEMTAASEHALIYDDEPLEHRILVVYEASGLESDKFSYIVRSLLSEGCLRYPTVQKVNGELKTQMIERDGPTALITTTTALRLHQENETRLLSLASDESAEQTSRVLEALAEEDSEEIDYERWHALQRWLELGERRVTIPYRRELANRVPPVAVRLRRDFGSVLALIRAHALLHQATRDRDERGRIVATVEDYAVVRDLLAEVVSEGVGKTVKAEVREIVEKVRELAGDDGGSEVKQRQLVETLELDKSTVSRRVRAALEAGYLVNREKTRGRPHQLVPGDPLPDDLEILPPPEKVTPEVAADE